MPVASLMKRGELDIVRPSWILDCIQQTESDRGHPRMLLPLEPRHMFFTREDSKDLIEQNIDEYGDSFARDSSVDELRSIFDEMPKLEGAFNIHHFREQLEEHHHELGELPGWMFEGVLIYADLPEHNKQIEEMMEEILAQDQDGRTVSASLRMRQACNTARFAGASFTEDLEDASITHVLVNDERARVKILRKAFST